MAAIPTNDKPLFWPDAPAKTPAECDVDKSARALEGYRALRNTNLRRKS